MPALLGGTVHAIVAPSTGHGFGHQSIVESVFGSKRYRVSYAHGRVAPPVRKGQTISAGTKVLEEGTSGATSGSCMHQEVFDIARGVFINPEPFNRQVLTTGGGGGTLLPTQRLVTSVSLNRRRTPDRKSAPINEAGRGPSSAAPSGTSSAGSVERASPATTSGSRAPPATGSTPAASTAAPAPSA
ncbi:hypothetical protein [Microbacterium sp. NIBRBAC000506063]|uniref:hypothetical protein n=1 Tax=Microbacterium sp. NIBRBAC000506063 TaxID=2734618 RepID=UPI0021D47B50|nr:hypothetical protein [Microbacterium sp. NIBRBAC000506063]